MARVWALLLAIILVNAPGPSWAADWPLDAPASTEPQAEATARNRLLDLSAEVLKPYETQWNVFWARFAIGLGGWLQLSTDIAADVILVPNMGAKVALLDMPNLKASAQINGWFLPSRTINLSNDTLKISAFAVPMELRATMPLGNDFETNVALGYRWLNLTANDTAQGSRVAKLEASVVLYDERGAWFVRGAVPIFNTATVSGEMLDKKSVSGSLTLDDLLAWSILVGRDLTFMKSAHLRLGLGYRNRPGIFLLESFGQVVTELDIYWR